jgi:hypothetical protein
MCPEPKKAKLENGMDLETMKLLDKEISECEKALKASEKNLNDAKQKKVEYIKSVCDVIWVLDVAKSECPSEYFLSKKEAIKFFKEGPYRSCAWNLNPRDVEKMSFGDLVKIEFN